jgi:VIT1/CCC1 family predicted Fe2+/Mn2+ transporter
MASDYRRLEETQQSFRAGDGERSRRAHDELPVVDRSWGQHEEPTLSTGRLLKPAVFGGLDGISTIFALIAGSEGAQLDASHLLAVGAGTLVAGAFGMGLGEYVSSVAEDEVAERERMREAWEVENYPEGEVREMMDIYTSKGVSKADAELVARTLAKYKQFWIEHMLLTEIGIIPPDPTESHVVSGLAMFVAFLMFGAIPLLSYSLIVYHIHSASPFLVTVFTSLSTLFTLGVTKSHILSQGKIKGGMLMTLQGSLCAAAAYWLGDVVQAFLLR